jgi:RNA polymerase sigma factor (sigma-70 family)
MSRPRIRSNEPLDRYQQQMVVDHMKLMYSEVKRAKRYMPVWVDEDDLVDLAQQSIVEAAQSYDPSVSRFTTWATKVIRQDMKHYARSMRRARLVDVELVHAAAAEEPDHEQSSELARVAMGSVTSDELAVLYSRAEGLSFMAIGAMMDFSGERARQVFNAAQEKAARAIRRVSGCRDGESVL